MQEQAHPPPQGLQGHRHYGAFHHGLVPRFQAAHHNKRPRGNTELHHNPGTRGRQGAAQKGTFPGQDIWKALRRQGLYWKEPDGNALHRWRTADHVHQEQHEELADDNVGQNIAQETIGHRNGERRTQEHLSN